ncbi:MAG: PilW family protein [Candidatus Competibacter sp.]|nr:PilW family protein [Candidatus Competibacter sp.]
MHENRWGTIAAPIRWRKTRQGGFTLVEIMVALVLGLLVVNAVIQVFLGTQQSGRIQQAASRMQEDGRLVVDLMTRYIRLAGYVTNPWDKGDTAWAPARGERGFPASAPFAQGQVVSGGSNNINGMDSIRIRYQGSGGDPNNAAIPGDGSITTCLGAAAAVNTLVDVTLSLTANDPADGRSLQCTDNNTGDTQPLVAGLEGMQIWYGVSQDQGGVSGVDAVGRLAGATTYLTAAQVTAANLWNRVIGVQISLLVRSDQDRLASQPQTYTFPITNNAPTTPADQRLRYVMGSTTSIRNQAP